MSKYRTFKAEVSFTIREPKSISAKESIEKTLDRVQDSFEEDLALQLRYNPDVTYDVVEIFEIEDPPNNGRFIEPSHKED